MWRTAPDETEVTLEPETADVDAHHVVGTSRPGSREEVSDGAPAMRGHRWFAAVYDIMTALPEHMVLRRLRRQVAGAATGRVLEIGAGTGANLPHYGKAESVVATDPDPYMLRRARRRSEALVFPIEFRQCPAEALPFPDASFDTVVSTLSLCTVRNPAQALSEVKRVLRPGGVLRFMEHVQADQRMHRKVQGLLAPAWRWAGAGCHLDRPTASTLEAAGFELMELTHRRQAITPLIIGTARRRD
jgi:ubiquinone/menaquinone biosynthesis C-methylase UbiE